MFELTNKALADLLSVINESGIGSFQLKTADYEISISCGDGAMPSTMAHASLAAQVDEGTPRSAASDASGPLAAAQPASVPDHSRAVQSAGAQSRDQAGLIAVPSPMVGAFYLAPEPGAPPYVQVGARVAPDTTVGLVEAMKVFTAVTAGVTGVVTAILVANGDFVEYGQSLVMVAPGAAAAAEGADQA